MRENTEDIKLPSEEETLSEQATHTSENDHSSSALDQTPDAPDASDAPDALVAVSPSPDNADDNIENHPLSLGERSPEGLENSLAKSSPEGNPEGIENSLAISAPANLPEGPEDTRPTILVVHASVGSGHRSAAIAISEAFELMKSSLDPNLLQGATVPEDLNVETLDILDFGRIVVNGDKTASMFTGFTRPFYDLSWRYSFTGRFLWGGGTAWSRIMYPKFTEYINEKKPIAVVCTHITAANATVGARMLLGSKFPIICVPTDYETEGLWPHRTVDTFCVANESMAETLRPRKVPEQDIIITGMPTRIDFRQSYDKAQVRSDLGIPQDKMVVLALAGAYLPRPYIHFRQTLDEILPYLHLYSDMHFVFIAGSDEQYAAQLRRRCAELEIKNVTIFDYVDQMAALMAASDLVLCKSGGLTVSECICARVPMILLGRTYGQEKINRLMLTAMGAAMHVTTSRELLETLRHISRNPKRVDAMLINGEILRYPNAALDIARITLVQAKKRNLLSLPRKRFLWFYWGYKPTHVR